MKKFTKFEQAAIKSTAKQVYRFYEQKAALDRKVEEFKKKIELQKAQVDQTIDAFESSVTEMVDGKRRFTMKPQEVLDMLDDPSLAEPAGEVFADEPVPADVPPMPGLEDAPSDESKEEPVDTELPVEDTAKKEEEEEEEGETDEFSDEEDSDEDESDEDDEDEEDEEDEDFDDDDEDEDEDEDADEDDEEPVAEEDVFDII